MVSTDHSREMRKWEHEVSEIENWREFLTAWEEEAKLIVSLIPESVVEEQERAERFPTRLMRDAAAPEDVRGSIGKLGRPLPLDMREFYLASNGWYQLGFDEYDLEILSATNLYRLAEAESRVVSAVMSYANDGSIVGVGSEIYKTSDADSLVVLSDASPSGLYLAVIDDRASADTCPCYVLRYQSAPRKFGSFGALMKFERDRCLNSLRSLLD